MMAIWKATSVMQTPQLKLVRWRVYEGEDGARHFVGYNITEGEGRVSSAVTSFDPATRRGVTASGRVYALVGPAGYDADAEYVWRGWLTVNVGAYHDVTDSVAASIAG